jgi:hypothetical protein
MRDGDLKGCLPRRPRNARLERRAEKIDEVRLPTSIIAVYGRSRQYKNGRACVGRKDLQERLKKEECCKRPGGVKRSRASSPMPAELCQDSPVIAHVMEATTSNLWVSNHRSDCREIIIVVTAGAW